MTDIRSSFIFEGIPWVYAPSKWLKPLAAPSPPPDQSTPPDQFSQPFLEAIHSFEGGRIYENDQYLKLFRLHAGLDHGTLSTSDADFAQCYALLMAYKLLDILTTRHLAQSSVPIGWEKESYFEGDIHTDLPELVILSSFFSLLRIFILPNRS